MRPDLILRLSLSLALVLVAFAVPAAGRAHNVVPNPGFETGTPCGATPVRSSALCSWNTGTGSLITRDTSHPHAGSASMFLGGYYSAAAFTAEPMVCAAIGPGSHPASYWYRDSYAEVVSMGAYVFAEPNCRGNGMDIDMLQWVTWDPEWHLVTGVLGFPPGTASATFYVMGEQVTCNPDDCGAASAVFDDLSVESVASPVPLGPAAASNQ